MNASVRIGTVQSVLNLKPAARLVVPVPDVDVGKGQTEAGDANFNRKVSSKLSTNIQPEQLTPFGRSVLLRIRQEISNTI